MRLLGQRVWRYVIVLFTFRDTLGNTTIEQHIESERKPLHWLIEKMEEMLAVKSSFYLSAYPETDGPQPEEHKSDITT